MGHIREIINRHEISASLPRAEEPANIILLCKLSHWPSLDTDPGLRHVHGTRRQLAGKVGCHVAGRGAQVSGAVQARLLHGAGSGAEQKQSSKRTESALRAVQKMEYYSFYALRKMQGRFCWSCSGRKLRITYTYIESKEQERLT